MTAQKQTETQPARPAARSTESSGRKPWIKKTPVQVVLEQIDRLQDDVTKKEEELKQAKKQLQKLEEARKVLE